MKKIKALISPFIPAVLKEAWGRKVFDDRPANVEIAEFGDFLVAFRKGTADEAVLQESFANDTILPAVPEYRPMPSDIVIDIGAHIGAFSLLASSRVPDGKVYAIEPCRDTHNFLRINLALNKVSNVSPHRLAVADRRGTITLYYDSGNWGHSVVKRLSKWSERVEACTLTEFMNDNGIRSCDFVKFNCEGAEFPIILGTDRQVLARCRYMLVQYHGDLWERNAPEELIAHLARSGFHCEVRNRSRQRGWIIATRHEEA